MSKCINELYVINNGEFISCELERGHDGPHKATFSAMSGPTPKSVHVEVQWSDTGDPSIPYGGRIPDALKEKELPISSGLLEEVDVLGQKFKIGES